MKMIDKEKILKYISDEMDYNDKIKFEEELILSTELKFQYEKILFDLKTLKQNSEIDFKESYFQNLLPKVRNKIDEKKVNKSFIPKFAVPVILLLIILSNLLWNNDTADNEENFSKYFISLDKSEKSEVVEDIFETEYITSYFDEDMSDRYIEELKTTYQNEIIGSSNMNSISFSIDEIIENVESHEASYIYDALINKDLIGEI